MYLMPRNARNALKIANDPAKNSYYGTREMIGSMFIVEKNSISKDEAHENIPSNMIHSTLKPRLFFEDSSVSKECTSYKLYNCLKKNSRHTEVI